LPLFIQQIILLKNLKVNLIKYHFHLIEFFSSSKDESYKNRWVQSTAKSDLGEFKLSHGKFYGDAKKDLGKYIN